MIEVDALCTAMCLNLVPLPSFNRDTEDSESESTALGSVV